MDFQNIPAIAAALERVEKALKERNEIARKITSEQRGLLTQELMAEDFFNSAVHELFHVCRK